MSCSTLALCLLRWLRSLASGARNLSVEAARRSATSVLQRFSLAEAAAALALVALTFALLVARELSLPTGEPVAEKVVSPLDAGAPVKRDTHDAAPLEPAL